MTDATFYNVWRTKTPEDRAELIAKMQDEAPALASKPGFVAMTVLECAEDGRLLVEGRWQSKGAFDAAVADDPDAQRSRQALETLGTAEPGLFTEAFRVGPIVGATVPYPDDPAFWNTFRREMIDAEGVRLNAVSGGTGEPVLLIPGSLETWGIWRRVLPLLADRYRVIAPDLRGFGDSEGPGTGYDKKTLARDMTALVDALGIDRYHVVGHDFGGQVAYRLAADNPDRVATLTAIETLLPGIDVAPSGSDAGSWIFPFHMTADIPEMLTAGRERDYVAALWRIFLHPQNEATSEDREEVERAFAKPGALAASFQLYRSIPQDIEDFAPAYAAKIATPVLALGGEHCFSARVIETFRQVANDVTGGVLEATAHFTPLERSAATAERVRRFLEEHPLAATPSNSPTSPSGVDPS